jgi:hypothetical protein
MSNKQLFSVGILAILGLSLFMHVSAETITPTTYKLLEPLPLGDNFTVVDQVDTATYVPNLIKLLIALAGALTVGKIIFAGIKYMSSQAFTGKGSAKDEIRDALFGFLLVISSYIILNTINPKLLDFDLDLKVATTTDHGPSSYKPTTGNDSCANCSPVNQFNFPSKSADANGGAKPGPCYVNTDLGTRLANLSKNLEDKGLLPVSWQVTEMYPPTIQHKDPCHSNGTCVDASLRSTRLNDNKYLATFLQAVKESIGTNFQYEVTSDVRLKQLQSDPRLRGFKIVNNGCSIQSGSCANAEHAHIEL